MIVNSLKNGWEIIFQRNHALLAGAIAQELKAELRPPRWIETLSAIIEHDDGQTDWSEGSHISEEGRPLDFTMYDFDLVQAKRVVTIARHKSQWITLLVSMHVCSLYGSLRKKYPELEEYLNELEGLQDNLRRDLEMNEEETEKHYRFLRWCDECSLILCQKRLAQNSLEIGKLQDHTHSIRRISNEWLSVEPWPFYKDEFSISAEVYAINQEQFSSTEELKHMLEQTSPNDRVWHFKKT